MGDLAGIRSEVPGRYWHRLEDGQLQCDENGDEDFVDGMDYVGAASFLPVAQHSDVTLFI